MMQSIERVEIDRSGIIKEMVGDQNIPRMVTVRQKFSDAALSNVEDAIIAELESLQLRDSLKPGMSIAVTAGSRGIDQIDVVVKTVCAYLQKIECKPFIIPAMGSHGGATAVGQLQILESLGVTESTMGVPIISSLDTEIIGYTDDGIPVHFSTDALKADGVAVVGRIKPHTAFSGPYESGLVKMMAIGLGKQQGAESCHSEGFGSMAENIKKFASIVLDKVNILLGLGVIENAYDTICEVKAVHGNQIFEQEPALLLKAKSLMPRILIDEFDLLIVDQIGKNFSGDGADPHISGTFATPYVEGGPTFERYVILDLSDETHGNASGLGMADFTTKRALLKVDFDASYPNCLTSRVVSGIKIPMVLNTDMLAIQAALFCLTGPHKNNPRIVRISNTSHIGTIQISESLLPIAEEIDEMTIVGEAKELGFDEQGTISEIN